MTNRTLKPDRQMTFGGVKIKDFTGLMKDNVIHMDRRIPTRVLYHWTGSDSPMSTIRYLNERLNGSGTVGYNYIVSNDEIYILADPIKSFMNSSGMGNRFDSDTIAIAVATNGKYPSRKCIESLRWLNEQIEDVFRVVEYCHHAQYKESKVDFGGNYWERLVRDIGLTHNVNHVPPIFERNRK